MSMDEILASLWVTPKCDGDIWLRNGGTQKFLAVDVHSTLVRDRSGATFRLTSSQSFLQHGIETIPKY